MEMDIVFYLSIAVIVGIVAWAWRVLNWVWLRPKKVEKLVRKQGFHGNSYRLLSGDMKQSAWLIRDAKSKPIHVSDNIAPRVIPLVSHIINNYGKKSFVWVGPTLRVHIMDPELIKEVFSKNNKFQKPVLNPLFKLFTNGLPTIEGDKWDKHRKLLNPAFHLEKLKCMVPTFYLCCCEMTRKWEEMMLEGASCELDVWPFLQTFARDVISRTGFGSSYKEGSRVFELQIEQAQLAIKSMQSVYIPGVRYLPTKRNQRMKAIEREIHFSLKSIINKKMEAIKAGKGSSDDLLGILLESNFNVQHGNKNVGMSAQDVIEECKVFYFAGQETTSVLLVWTMVLLSIHPNWQAQARKEVIQVIGNGKLDFEDLSQLKIVTMILYEVLRLYPPVALLVRRVNEETTLGDITLPPGVEVSLPIILHHHDPQIWGDDAKEFKPERFSEGVSKATQNQVMFFPFGGGPRICIGQNFAMLEAKLAIATILTKFSFELSPSYTHAPLNLFTVQPQYGANLILHKI
nr:cytochrome P450 [Aralia elata]